MISTYPSIPIAAFFQRVVNALVSSLPSLLPRNLPHPAWHPGRTSAGHASNHLSFSINKHQIGTFGAMEVHYKGNQEGEARLWIAPSVEATLQRHIHIFLSNLATKSQHHHAFITVARNLALSWALTQPQFIQGDVERPRTFVLSMMRESIQLGFLHIPRSTATR